MRSAEQFQTSGEIRSGPHQLIHRIAQHDLKAWEQFYEQMQGTITVFLAKRFYQFCDDDVADIAQVAMVTVMLKAATYRGLNDEDAVHWVKRIARNLAIDTLRQNKRFADLPETDSTGGEDPQPQEKKEWNHLWETLSPRERQVFRLLYAGKKPGEIAGELGITPSRVTEIKKSIRAKAKKIFPDEQD